MKKHIALALVIGLTILSGCGPLPEDAQSSIEETTKEDEDIVTLGQYKGLSYETKLVETSDEEIEKQMTEIALSANGGCFKEAAKEHISEEGDKVIMALTYSTTNEETGEEIPNMLPEYQIVLGKAYNGEEFDNALYGVKVGDEKEITVSEGDISSYSAVITRLEVPAEFTDEYVKSLGNEDIQTVEGFREYVKKNIDEEHRQKFEEALKEELDNKLYETSTFKEIPQELITEYEQVINDRLNDILELYKSQGKEYTKKDIFKKDMEAEGFSGSVDDYLKFYAEKNAKEYLMLKKVVDTEKLEISDDDIYSQLADMWIEEKDQYENLKEYIQFNPRKKEQTRRDTVCQTALEFIMNNADNGAAETQNN